ncbi:MAG: AAA family ATPase [Candidatus Coproplasma sp.]
MKLISCHIENFGNISNTDFNFTDGLNQFCYDNGWGKSTLAAFIKAMFYGLPSAKTTSKFNDRSHFKPFTGGKFGGNVTFEANGKIYRIERFFGDKTGANDTLKAYVGNVPTAEFDSKSPGAVIFGLDRDSFERTAFINSDWSDLSATDGMNAKLNNCTYAINGESDAATAISVLENSAKNLIKRGGKGEIDVQSKRVEQLNDTVENLKKIDLSLKGRYDERKALVQQISELEESEKARNRREVELSKWAAYDNMVNTVVAKKSEFAALSKKYPSGMPDSDEIFELSTAIRTRTELNAKLKVCGLSEEKTKKRAELSRLFEGGVPDGEKLAEAENGINKLRELKGERERLSSVSDAKLNELRTRFENKTPTEAEMNSLRASVNEYMLANRELTESLTPAAQPEKKGGALWLIFAVMGIICLVGGGLAVSLSIYVAIAAFVCGGACLVAAAIAYAKGRGNGADKSAQATAIAERKQAAEQAILSLLKPYGVELINVEYDAKTFEDSLNEYRELCAAEKERKDRISSLAEQEKELSSRLEGFFAEFGLRGDFSANLLRLRELVGEYARLNGESDAAERNKKSLEESLASAEAGISGVIKKYSVSEEGDIVTTLARDGELYRRLKKEIAEGQVKAERYMLENDLTSRPEPVEGEGVGATLNACRERLANLDRIIADDEANVDTLSEYENSLTNAKEKLKEMNERHKVLIWARDAVEKAADAVIQEYVAPVKNGFEKYAQAMEKAQIKFAFGKDFKLMFESNGELRSDEHLSGGQRAAVTLCYRLALIDNMYTEEKPFIIMDEPFAELDADGLKCAKKLLAELAKDRQFIYFCCHESRSMKD